MSADVTAVRFHFDPVCPWTWVTSRWLAEVAEERGFDVRWRSFSLRLLNPNAKLPADLVPVFEISLQAQRVVEFLAEQGRNKEAGAFYGALGTALHEDGATPVPAVLAEALKAAGAEDALGAATDVALDEFVVRSHQEAYEAAGPDIGSPVLVFEPGGAAAFGPIVTPKPVGAAALEVFDAVAALARRPEFFEFKRGRTAGPSVG